MTSVLLLAFLILALNIAGSILIIRAICKYMARQNANAFDYDYLAERTAEEVCKEILIIEGQRAMAYKAATPAAEDQSTGNRVGALELDESPQE